MRVWKKITLSERKPGCGASRILIYLWQVFFFYGLLWLYLGFYMYRNFIFLVKSIDFSLRNNQGDKQIFT